VSESGIFPVARSSGEIPIPAEWEPQLWEPLARSRGTTGSSGKPLYPCWGYTGLRRGEGAPQGGNYPPCRRPTTHKPSQLQLLPELHANTKPKPVPNSFARRSVEFPKFIYIRIYVCTCMYRVYIYVQWRWPRRRVKNDAGCRDAIDS